MVKQELIEAKNILKAGLKSTGVDRTPHIEYY